MSIFRKIKTSVMQRSRAKKLDHFYALCDQNALVLDVGVSNNEHNDSINLFLKNFRLPANQYTGLGVQNLDIIKEKYKDKNFVQYPGGVFPFKDNEFDWVFSNAVVEHVGNKEDQLLFIKEMLRVGKNAFFTTPNKWFPIESHTNVFFTHWFDNAFYKWCEKNRPQWTRETLLLLGFKNLQLLMEKSGAKSYTIYQNRMLTWPMTFTVVASN